MTTRLAPTFAVQRAQERGHADHGWLDTYHSFSFADYYDPQYERWGSLRVFNDDRVSPAQGFPTHPHRDMEIVTYVLDGELAHRDSMGNHGVVGPGGVQFMSAGTGVRHSEYNHSKTHGLHFLQMWVIPGTRGADPVYGQHHFEAAQRTNRFLAMVSGEAGTGAPIAITQRATLYAARLEAGALVHQFSGARYGFFLVAAGSATVNGERLDAGDAVRIFDIPTLDVRADAAEVVLWDLTA